MSYFKLLILLTIFTGCLGSDEDSPVSGGSPAAPSSPTFPSDAPGDATSIIASEGCGQTAPGGSTFNITVGGVSRTYMVFLPSGYDNTIPYDLVFGFHGNTFTASGFASTQLSTSMRTASSNQAIFIYPQGLDVTGLPMEAAGGQTGTGWDWRPSGRDIAFFDALYSQLRTQYCFDRSHVYSFGRSHGGFFNTTLACVRGNLLRASAETAGGLSTAINSVSCSSPSIPYWKQHNISDPTVSYTFGVQTRDRWISENSCPGTTVAVSGRADCVQYTGCESGGALIFCSTNVANHDSPAYAGGDIWAFFSSY